MAAEQVSNLRPMASLRKHLPGRKASTRHTAKAPSGLPDFEMLKSSDGSEPVVISVAEARPSTSESSRKVSTDNAAGEERSQGRPRRPTITIPAKAHTASVTPPLPPPPPNPPQFRAPTPADVPLPRSSTNTPELARSDSRATTAVQSAETPVMRSMFPSYNPTVSLGQQQYYPSTEVIPALTRMREVAGPSTYIPHSQQDSRNSHLAPAKQEVVKKESPLRRSESLKRPTAFSKPEDLVDLWCLANGQMADDPMDQHVLELSCDDLSLNSEVITFSTTTNALYALSASASNQISTTRIHPSDPRTKIPICSSTLNRPSRQDPLIASIFPKLAGLMALDQSSTAAIERGLDRQAGALLQAEAIHQAQEREASMLLWDSDSGRFCLLHPTLLDNTATTMRIEITPNPTSPERITILAPETDTPLLTLEMGTLSLHLHTPAITALPSLYILDTLLTALLTLLLHLHRSCADPSNRYTPPQAYPSTCTSRTALDDDEANFEDPTLNPLYFPPPPPSLHSTASRRDLRRQSQRPPSRMSTAFRSVRSVKSSRSLASTHYGATDPDKDIELGELEPETGRGRGGGEMVFDTKKKKKKEKRKAPKGIIDVEDPALPKGTQRALRFLYWVFEVVFWVLGVVVQVLAAAVVGAGKFARKL